MVRNFVSPPNPLPVFDNNIIVFRVDISSSGRASVPTATPGALLAVAHRGASVVRGEVWMRLTCELVVIETYSQRSLNTSALASFIQRGVAAVSRAPRIM